MAECFNFYLSSTIPFFKYLGEAVSCADTCNKARVYSIFPAAVAASMLKSYDDSPEGYEDITNITPNMFHNYKPSDKKCDRGSFGWYLVNSGHFVTAMAKLIIASDSKNLKLINNVYPQMVAAFCMDDWDKTPEGFDNVYDSYCDYENVIPFKPKV
jgi:hypothetical protein